MTDDLRATVREVLVLRYGARENPEWYADDTLMVLWPLIESALAEEREKALEEHESALCPEDYGCKEWIASLKKQRDTLQAKLDALEGTDGKT